MRTAIVTGASSGLGLECTRALVASGWHVVMAVREPARALEALSATKPSREITVSRLELASLASVREFLAAELPPADALVCNAGVQVPSSTRYSQDGIELTFAVNHLAHFALTTGLLERLRRPARIVLVSSDTHDPARRTGMPAPRYTTVDEMAHNDLSGRRRYTTSKLCNVLFAYELARRTAGSGVTVNAFNPGLMPGSGLAREYTAPVRLAWRHAAPLLRVLPQVRSVTESAQHLAALVTDARYGDRTGAYFDGPRAIRSSVESYDPAKALALWQGSERLLHDALAHA